MNPMHSYDKINNSNLKEKRWEPLVYSIFFKSIFTWLKDLNQPLTSSKGLYCYFLIALVVDLSKWIPRQCYNLVAGSLDISVSTWELWSNNLRISTLRGFFRISIFIKLSLRRWQWLLSAAFWKIIAALKSHMTCYNLNLNSWQNYSWKCLTVPYIYCIKSLSNKFETCL